MVFRTVPGTQRAEQILPMCTIIMTYESITLVQDANKEGRQVGQPVGSGKACQRGKPEQGPKADG